jgi:CRISPR system Cascade subunit CasB
MSTAESEAAIAAQWWRGLQPSLASGERNPRADRAALAELRRADLPAAMQTPATLDLFRRLGRRRPEALPDIALCAAALASVREDDPGTRAARSLGAPPGEPDDRAVMSPLRFRRLIEAATPEDRLVALRRAVALAHGRINVRDLAAACLDWSEVRRRRWIFEYYAAGYAAPPAQPAVAETPEETPEETPA